MGSPKPARGVSVIPAVYNANSRESSRVPPNVNTAGMGCQIAENGTDPIGKAASGADPGAHAVDTGNLLIHAAGKKSSVHRQQMPGDKTRSVGGEEYRCPSKLFEFPEAPHRRTH